MESGRAAAGDTFLNQDNEDCRRLMQKTVFWICRKLNAAMLMVIILVLLTLAQVLIRLVPFRFYVRLLRRPAAGPTAPMSVVRSLRRKLSLGVRWLPWHPKCLPQSVTGRLILSASGYASNLFLGVKDDGNALAAHAWLKSGDMFVCGKSEAVDFGVVAEF